MKRSLLTAIITVLSLSHVFAQKGTWLWYGNLGGSHAAVDAGLVDGVKTSFSTTDGIGYQFSDHWHVGLQGSYHYAESEHYDSAGATATVKTPSWSYGIFVRYSTGKRVYGYLQLDAGWAGSRQRINDVETGKSDGFGAGLTPAVGVNVYHGWCINLNLGGISYNSSNPNNVTTTSLVYNIGQTFVFGISKIFGHGVNKPAAPVVK